MTVRTPEESTRAASELWQAIFARLSNHLRREQLWTWFPRVCASAFDGQVLTLAVPSEFHRTWILENYGQTLSTAAADVLGYSVEVQVLVNPEVASRLSVPPDPTAEGEAKPQDSIVPAVRAATEPNAGLRRAPARVETPPMERAAPGAQAASPRGVNGAPPQPTTSLPALSSLGGSLSLSPQYVFENFVVGPCNCFAFAGAMGVAGNPAKAHNPLFLHGSVGLGKTHLLQAICHETLRRRPETRILYLSCETFTNHFIAAIERGSLEEFRNRYRSVDFLVVDDVHFLSNKERTQEEFFHTFNTLFLLGKQIVLSSDSPAHEIPSLQARLVSRFKSGLEAEISKPCLETRLAVLTRKARDLGASVPDDVLRHLAERITNNVRELEGAINRISGYAALQREVVSLDLVRRIMPELDADRSALVRFEDVSSAVAKRYHVKVLDLQSRRRTQTIAFPRQVAMYLARRLTKHSLVEIGGFFGGRDHTTVLYAIEKITERVKSDPELRDAIAALTADLDRPTTRPS